MRGDEDLSLCVHSVPEPVRSSSHSLVRLTSTLRSGYDCPQFTDGKTEALTEISQITNDRIRVNIRGCLHTQLIHIYIKKSPLFLIIKVIPVRAPEWLSQLAVQLLVSAPVMVSGWWD